MHDGTRVQEADNTDPGPPLANTRVKKNVETHFVLHQKLVIKLSKMQCTKFSQF